MIKILCEGTDEAGAYNYYDASHEFGNPKTIDEAIKAIALSKDDGVYIIVEVKHGELKSGIDGE